MEISDEGVLSSSNMYFLIPSEFAQNVLYYLQYAGIFDCTEDYRVQRNFLNLYLLMLIDYGEMYIEYRGQNKTVSSGNIILMDCKYQHLYKAATKLKFRWIHFSGNGSQAYCDQLYNRYGSVFDTSSTIDKTVNNLLSMVERNVINEHQASVYIHQILGELSNTQSRLPYASNNSISRAIEFISQHYAENLSLRDMAAQVNLSPYYFTRLFNKYTNCSPHEYLLNVRLKKAQEKLVMSDDSVENVGFVCGFNNASHFIRAFKKNTGMTPNQFRRIQF
ncbi:transcription regulator hth arac- type [Lucifera butyrica]|uniref:Transcription regulator hth arac- type n=1 Tax=Lucifera butyrica TaxID=1351585 RepID=A0A498R460_9FIRM|nr:AraC family transcriptional regulator [Lucifera butyrica]VBB04963.1 transcription regulator hth arac- type [Lucifera butyrica]